MVFTTYKKGDDWGMVYYCFTLINDNCYFPIALQAASGRVRLHGRGQRHGPHRGCAGARRPAAGGAGAAQHPGLDIQAGDVAFVSGFSEKVRENMEKPTTFDGLEPKLIFHVNMITLGHTTFSDTPK